LSLFAEDMIPYPENHKESSMKLLELINRSARLYNTSSIFKNQLYSYVAVMNKLKIKNTISPKTK
jgi:hypothetical protein